LVDRALKRKGRVERDGELLFTMRNYGRTTSMRLRRFFTKEPETIRWMDEFAPGSVMLDIGANVGSYTLYAAWKGHRVLALEPDALNFALLNLNIADNHMNDRVMAYPIAMHNRSMIAELNMSTLAWGGAHNSFERALDEDANCMNVLYRQGGVGMRLDEFVEQTGAVPNYLKIDVDGNEFCVLQGAPRTLAAPMLRGVLVELSEGHPEYAQSLKLLNEAGLSLQSRVSTKKSLERGGKSPENHIFIRVPV
jgi:FkbM family methyltransferase